MTAQDNRGIPPAIVEHATGMPGFRLICGDTVSFPRRRTLIHADYVIKLTVSGQGAPFYYRGVEDHAPCAGGHMSVFEPFEPVVAATSNCSTSFISLLVDPSLLQAERETSDSLRSERLQAATLAAPALARELLFIQRELLAGAAATDVQEHITSAFALFLQARLERAPLRHSIPLGVLRSREMILDRLADKLAGEELEKESGFSRFDLTRLFSRYYGVSLHEFRLRARIALAMRLLACAHDQTEVALMLGFFDQSHFHPVKLLVIILVIVILIPSLDGGRVGGDGAVDLDPIAFVQFGVGFGEFAEDAEFLFAQVDFRKHPQDP
jgi:AraC-like DNA-binding protein